MTADATGARLAGWAIFEARGLTRISGAVGSVVGVVTGPMLAQGRARLTDPGNPVRLRLADRPPVHTGTRKTRTTPRSCGSPPSPLFRPGPNPCRHPHP